MIKSEDMRNTVDQKEIQAFSKDAAHWWDQDGPFKPLHRLNPVRLTYMKERICGHYGLDALSLKPFTGLDILDVGCGGGLVCEPMARLGGNVTGADADPKAIEVAQEHAAQSGLDITYENKPAEQIEKKFDVVLALEIIEHVSDPASFVKNCAALCKDGGLVIFSTLNRTPKSYALGIVAAEYILRWVPQGTHSWKKFIKPSELARHGRDAGLSPQEVQGLIFNPLKNEFSMSKTDMDVNYFMVCTKS
jgi:2-polyprenyl-6-hydroxyphenyl methylase/3-demethylubiquinone-9 3-methyltransferase